MNKFTAICTGRLTWLITEKEKYTILVLTFFWQTDMHLYYISCNIIYDTVNKILIYSKRSLINMDNTST